MGRGRKISAEISCVPNIKEKAPQLSGCLTFRFTNGSVLKRNSIHCYSFSICWKCSWSLLPRCHSLNQEKRTTLMGTNFLIVCQWSHIHLGALCASHKNLESLLSPLCTLVSTQGLGNILFFFFLGTYFLPMITHGSMSLPCVLSFSLESLWSNKC